jgi:mono/diheme cytochrome c family protein
MNPSCSTSSHSPNGSEPKAAPVAVPVIVFIALALIFYWATIYIDAHGGGFSAKVYTPYTSTKELDKYLPKSNENPLIAKGRQLYSTTCAVCHQENGSGSSGNGCPPLAGSEWVTGSPGKIIRIISKGLTGPIEVKGQQYGTGTMPSIGDALPAESVAAIASYVRSQWGNKAPLVKPADVEKVRGEIKDHAGSYTAAELKDVQ